MAFKSKTGSVLTKNQIGITHSSIGATLVSNCNDASDANVEYYTNNATENKPTDTGTYLLWCHKINSSTITQFATLKNVSAKLWMRIYNGSWGSWTIVTRPLDVYPVGSVYTSNSSTNPAQYFGGTWIQIAATETLCLTGTTVVDPESRAYGKLFTLAQVQTMLHDAYGIDAANVTRYNVFVDTVGGDWDDGGFITSFGTFYNDSNGDDSYYAYFSGSTSSAQRVQYTILYNREMYKFVRTA